MLNYNPEIFKKNVDKNKNKNVEIETRLLMQNLITLNTNFAPMLHH
jgi:hypothetical protein